MPEKEIEKEEIEIIEADDARDVTEESVDRDKDRIEPEASEEESKDDKDSDDDDAVENEGQEHKISLSAERRKERRRRQRENMERDKAMIAQQGKTIEELVSRLAAVENTQHSLRLNAVDNAIGKQKDQIERIKSHLATVDDRNVISELQDKLVDEKLKLRELENAKEQASKAIKDPKKGNIDVASQEKDRLLRQWVARNSWFDPNGRGVDSKIAIAVDQALSEEGIFLPHTPEYYDELNERLREQLPHRFDKDKRKSPPVTSSRQETNGHPPKVGKNQFYLSKERKEAMIQAGVWGTPEQDRYVKSYMDFDKEAAARR